jgi:hypothetical protein
MYKAAYPKKSYNKSPTLCTKCEISVSYSLRDLPKVPSLLPVSNRQDNAVLAAIYKKNNFVVDTSFVILVDNSRYQIKICVVTKNIVRLKQYFLHYDDNRGALIPVNVRFVQLTL